MAARCYYKDLLPLTAMLVTVIIGVGSNILFKAASLKGMSYLVFLFYSNFINTLLMLPVPFLLCRTVFPLFKFPLLSRICAIGTIGLFCQLIGYKGIQYSSPTMASAMSNLMPAWTFLFAGIFRMEKLDWRSSSTQSKIIGTIVSIMGALMMVLYKGPKLESSTSSKTSPISLHHQHMGSPLSHWLIGGLFLGIQHIGFAFIYILQTQIMQICPSEILLTFACFLYTTIIAAPVCFIAEPELSAWRISPDITMVSILYAGVLGGAFLGIMHLWCLHLKGPVYVAAFSPLTIAVAAAMASAFLGEALHLGSVIGAVLITSGVYSVIWGKAKEEEMREILSSSSTVSPLLKAHGVEESLNKSEC
ncbi:WAT1-related protein At5g40240 isoform X2 [Manihot esculenta]|uniref:WAT1-related protein At5g40240 isoform X2 n=1 Tax=Manihot esculenta TaxID=3983 RepID=UPI001CC4BC33|nr:WAT1-related protein At5g40240 isoform X2 [Manihot esculenta]